MEYQIITTLLHNAPNQPSKFSTKNLVEINDNARGMYNTNSQINFKTTMLMSSFCNFSDAYIFVKGTISVAKTAATNNANKKSNI